MDWVRIKWIENMDWVRFKWIENMDWVRLIWIENMDWVTQFGETAINMDRMRRCIITGGF